MGVEESMELDGLLEVENCVRCNDGGSGSRKLMVCSEKGCPIALHEECMCARPVFDQLGKFYCPYCAYKREFFRCRELGRKVMGSKSVLSKFIDAGEGEDCGCETGGWGGVEVRGQYVGVEGGGAVEGGTDQRREIEDVRGEERIDEDPEEEEIVEETQEEDAEPRETMNNDNARDGLDRRDEEDCLRVSEESKGGSDEEEQEEETEPQSGCCVQEMTNNHNAHGLSDQRDEEDGKRVPEENEGESEDEEQMQSVEKEVPGNSTVVPESDELDTGSPLVRKQRFKQKSKRIKQPQSVASLRTVPSPSRELSARRTRSAEEHAKNQNGKAKTFSKKERENQESARNLVLPNVKGKRSKWTDEEIKMLKEGVRVCGSSNGKMQWKKILEYGHKVFHRTREPVDLKDKWRRSLGKENKDNAHDGFDQRDEKDGIRLSEENEGKSEDEEQMRSVEKEVPGKSNVDSKSENLDPGSPLVRSKQLKQKAKTKEQPPNAKTFSKREREIQESSRNLVLPNGKRKRLDWTDEELKMLKEGVRLHGTLNGKMQWKEILEYGHNVFHVTRQPVDLKDKWRRYFREKARKR